MPVSPKRSFVMKDWIGLIINIVVSIFAIAAAVRDQPILGLLVVSGLFVAYIIFVFYEVYKGRPGNLVLRFSPLFILLIVGGSIFWFWPAKVEVLVYTDINSNGLPDKGEPGIAMENIELIDAHNVSRNLYSDSDGRVQSEQIPRGMLRIKLRDMYFMTAIRRGSNWIVIGIPPPSDKTPPDIRIFLGDEIFSRTRDTPERKIYAHIWYEDNETNISKVEIDWGTGWEEVELGDPVLNFYILQHEYKRKGRKRVKVRVTNAQDLSSTPTSGPMRQDKDYADIYVR